jgi:hypothetical protein
MYSINDADLACWLLCDTEYLTWDVASQETSSNNHITYIYAPIINTG